VWYAWKAKEVQLTGLADADAQVNGARNQLNRVPLLFLRERRDGVEELDGAKAVVFVRGRWGHAPRCSGEGVWISCI
jgi:hypothetical protein